MAPRGRHPQCRLTDLMVRQAGPGRHSDGNGLQLFVRPSGARSWVQRLVIRGRRRDLGLGSYPLVSLGEARRVALENRRMARSGQDPTVTRTPVTAPTVREAVEAAIAIRRVEWRDVSTEKKWRRMFREFVLPRIGDTSIDRVTLGHVSDILTPLGNRRGSTGYVLRQHLAYVFKWAVAHGHRRDNPADAVKPLLLKARATVRHHPSLPYTQIADAMIALQASRADETVKLMLLFLVLCASRFKEVAEARWSEISSTWVRWTLPPERMKAAVEHQVPLSVQALAILDRARALNPTGPLIFPVLSGRRAGRPVASSTVSRLMRSLGFVDPAGRPIVVHGFRSTFRVWAAEKAKASFRVCEVALAHGQPNQTVAAYEHTDYFEDRKELMQKWADYVQPPSAVPHPVPQTRH